MNDDGTEKHFTPEEWRHREIIEEQWIKSNKGLEAYQDSWRLILERQGAAQQVVVVTSRSKRHTIELADDLLKHLNAKDVA